MRETSVKFLAQGCGGRILGDENIKVTGVQIDSRACMPGDLFVAIIGPNNNGHKYIPSAYDLGARTFLVSEEKTAEEFLKTHSDAAFILVKDTEWQFCHMAASYLAQFDVIKIGITGSTGKTSTKALTTAVMQRKYKTITSRKNYNTNLGIAVTCFDADETTQAIVFEMGMDRIDELKDNAGWLKPQIAAITNVGVVHMENIGSREGVAIEKLKISSYLQPDQTLIYNCDSPFLNEKEIRQLVPVNFKLYPTGAGEEAVLKLSGLENKGMEGIAFDLESSGEKQHFQLPFLGLHNGNNGAIAAAVGLHFGVSLAEAAKGMPMAEIEEKRLQVSEMNGITLIDDSYNANPDSMASGLRTLAAIDAKRRIAVISDMKELGSASDESHLNIGKLVADLGIDVMVAIGANRALYAQGSRQSSNPVSVINFENEADAESTVISILKPGDAVLVKGSNSTKLYLLSAAVKNHFSK